MKVTQHPEQHKENGSASSSASSGELSYQNTLPTDGLIQAHDYPASHQDHVKTQALLAAVLEKLEEAEKERTITVVAMPEGKEDWLRQVADGKFSVLLGLISNSIGAWPLLAWALIALLNIAAWVPQVATTGWKTLAAPLAMAALIVVTAFMGTKIRRRRTKGWFLLTVLIVASVSTILYFIVLSVSLARQYTFFSGVLFTLTVTCIYSIVKRLVKEGPALMASVRDTRE